MFLCPVISHFLLQTRIQNVGPNLFKWLQRPLIRLISAFHFVCESNIILWFTIIWYIAWLHVSAFACIYCLGRMLVYVYICMFACMFCYMHDEACMYVYLYKYIFVCMYICMLSYMYYCMYIYVFVCNMSSCI